MPRSGSRLWWVETVMAVGSGLLAVLTLVTREWVEVIFRVDPDHGSGSLEWLIVLAAGSAAAALSLLARREWRRLHPAAEPG